MNLGKFLLLKFRFPITLLKLIMVYMSSVETYLNNGANQVMENEGIWLAVVKESCKNLTREDKNPLESGVVNNVWEYSSALFLCMTILTTIGKCIFLQ